MKNNPDFLTEAGLASLSGGYLLDGETVRDAYWRICNSIAGYLKKPELADKFFDYSFNKGWLCFSSPVLSNCGTNRGLPISCYSYTTPDSLQGIYDSYKEAAMLTKYGGGLGCDWNAVRARGTPISQNGKSNGVISWLKILDSMMWATSQGGVRRGNAAPYLSVDHGDFKEFLQIRKPKGDINRQCQNLHHGAIITNDFMNRCKARDQESLNTWNDILYTRLTTGEPYMLFVDNAQKEDPIWYKDKGLSTKVSNLCVSPETEILTSNGFKVISELENQKVIIWNGEEWSETTIFKTGENQELLEVEFSNGETLKCTPYHKFKIQKGYDRGSGKNKLEIIEKRAYELEENDKLIKWDLPFIEFNKSMKDPYTQGFFSGDGCSFNGKNHIDLYGEKQKLLNFFNYKENRSMNLSAGKLRIYINDSYKKFEVPSNHTLDSRLKWLAGLLDSDGTVAINGTNKALQIGSIKKDFLIEVKRMLMTMGVESKVTKMRDSGENLLPDGKGGNKFYNTKSSYRLLIGSNDLIKLKELGLECNRLILETEKNPNRDATQFVKITKIKKLEEKSDTYCFTESKRNMGIFNGILAGNCAEIMLHTDEDHTFVCCLSSMNLAKWDEWKDTDAVKVATWFLDGVMEEFIQKAREKVGFERSVRFAEKSRALGLGVLGWHTLLQQKMIPFEDMQALFLNKLIFNKLQKDSKEASKELAKEYGEPEWLEGYGYRNSHQLAVAPTVTNSVIAGQVSPGIEPIAANIFIHKTAKGNFVVKNPNLIKLLEAKNQNTSEVWEEINSNGGSVKTLNFLSDEEKLVFKTAREINQFVVIKQAADRQPFIDQGQSVNLFFTYPDPETKRNNPGLEEEVAQYISDVHKNAWELGLKSLYYLRSEGAVKADVKIRREEDCDYCS